MATKLKDMKLTSVDLVRAGANQEADICLFKSATDQETAPEATGSPTEPEKNILKRFIAWLKENPTEAENEPHSPIEKADEKPDPEEIYKTAIIESIKSIVGDENLTKDEKIEIMEKSFEQFYKRRKQKQNDKIDTPEETENAEPVHDLQIASNLEGENAESGDRYEEIEEVHKYNHHHGADGKFSSSGGGGGAGASFGARPESGGWAKGTVDGYQYHAKVYQDTSGYGISGGSVSKLEMRDASGKIVISYERGTWDKKPTKKLRAAIDKITAHYDKGLERYEPGESWDTTYNPNSPLKKSESLVEIDEVQKYNHNHGQDGRFSSGGGGGGVQTKNGVSYRESMDPSWGEYDTATAEAHLMNYGRIYLDEYGAPIDDEYQMEDADMQWAKKSAGTGTH